MNAITGCREQHTTAAAAELSKGSMQLELHKCEDGRCECTRKRTLHAPRPLSGGSRRPRAASSSSDRLPTAFSAQRHEAAGAGGGGLRGSSINPTAQTAATDEQLITYQSVSADGVMRLTLRPSQPHAVEDPARRLLANQAYVKAKAARNRPGDAESSSSEDEEELIANILRRAVAAGSIQPAAAEAAAAAMAVRGPGQARAPQRDDSRRAALPKHQAAFHSLALVFVCMHVGPAAVIAACRRVPCMSHEALHECI